jgi:hypothetical protein
VAVILYLFLGNAGFGSLIWVVTAEILPPKVRSVANSITICFSFLCGFVIAKTFVDLLEGLQRSGTNVMVLENTFAGKNGETKLDSIRESLEQKTYQHYFHENQPFFTENGKKSPEIVIME